MSARGQRTLLEHFERACATYMWIRFIATITLVGSAFLLLRVSGGFPPTAWIFLIRVIPLASRLWHLRGTGILLPLGAVTTLSASLAVAWVILLRFGWMIVQSWRQGKRAHVSSSAMVSMQVRQEHEASLLPLRARGDRRGSAASPQQENAIVAAAISPSPASASNCSTPSFDTHGPSPDHQSHEEADSDLKVGAHIHLAQGQPWKEDALFTSQGNLDGHEQTLPYGLFVVADGIGGQRLTGHEACELAVGSVTNHILQGFSGTEATIWDEPKLMDMVIAGIQAANQSLYECNQEHQAYLEVSMAVCLVVQDVAYAANIGETRVYLYCESAGLLKKTRNDVGGTKAQCMGERTEVGVDSFIMTLQHGDRLLLCTDGLWKCVCDLDIEGILSNSVPNPSQTCNVLIQNALEGGENDHIGNVVVLFHSALAKVEVKEKD
jgi:serine/threonine protein phosphatase PrpC